MTPALRERLEGAAMVFFDGTLWRDDEMVCRGPEPKDRQTYGPYVYVGRCMARWRPLAT